MNRLAVSPRRLRTVVALALFLTIVARNGMGQSPPGKEFAARPGDSLPAIAKFVRENPSAEELLRQLPALTAAADDDATALEALPLLEQSVERLLPDAAANHHWLAVAAALKAAARARYGQVDPVAANRHLQTLRTLYNDVARARKLDADEPWRRLSDLHAVAAEYLRGEQTAEALAVLGEAADLNLPYREELDDGRAALAGALNRRLAALDAAQRYDLLHDWTMPAASHRMLRVFSSPAPCEAPPAAFARALGERPHPDAFPIPEIGGASGLFSTAWSLVAAARETGRLKKLTAELSQAVENAIPNADLILLLAQIAAGERTNRSELAASVRSFAERPFPPSQSPNGAEAGVVADDLSILVLAAACTTNESALPAGETLLRSLGGAAGPRVSERLAPLVRRMLAAAAAKRFPAAKSATLDDPNLDLWLPAGAAFADDASRGAVREVWLAHEDHILHVAGPRHDYLCFRYPLAGDFEFHVEAQDGGPTGGGLAFGGLAFRPEGSKLSVRIGNLDAGREWLKMFPFIRQEAWPTFQRLSIRSTNGAVQFVCNGHPVLSGPPAGPTSPWLALASAAGRTPAFRGFRIVGQPIIPRQVRLTAGDKLSGWFSHYYPAAAPNGAQVFGDAPKQRPPLDGFDWFAFDGEIHGAHRPKDLAPPAPSRLSYFRPLADFESIDYEFFYEPGRYAVHPALGRLAFLIEPGGVELHWMTAGDSEWTGLDAGNTLVEPLNRRGPKPLPLKPGQWNQASISLAADTAALSLNGTIIYVRKLEPENSRTFSFYHDRRRAAARIREVVMQGNWPEQLSERQLANLTAPRDAARAEPTRSALGAVFADCHLPDAALYVHRRAAALPLEARYACLADWVLPGADHAGLRLALDYSPTHPAPPVAGDDPLDARRLARARESGESRVQIGGNLVSPALDLVDAATQLGKLDDVRRRVEQAPQTDDEARRARLAMLAIVDIARQQPQPALEALDKLLASLEAGAHTGFFQRWPETLATHQALAHPATRKAGGELAYHLLMRQVRNGADSGSEAWRRQMLALVGLAKHLETDTSDDALANFDSPPNFRQWRAASRITAQTRGRGYPLHRWKRTGARADHVVSHNQDYLYFQSPLAGDLQAEYDVPGFYWRDTYVVIGGWWASPIYDLKTYAYGNYHGEQPRGPIVPVLTKVAAQIHGRTVVQGDASRTYANARLLHEQPLPHERDPWIAIRNLEHFSGSTENFRIAGQGEIPAEICLTADASLNGWLPYYEAMPGSPDAWGPHGVSEQGGGIAGRRLPQLTGTFAESLARYHRPMFEDGVIEYEFYYRQGETCCHPALDRLVFLLDPAGVRIHWITDGAYERSELAADNAFDEPECRRGPQRLPLVNDAENKLALELKGNLVRLRLNGQLVYERALEATNQRTFGLFHFADQTEALVRRVIWRGDWPRQLPKISEQELAGKYGDFLDPRRAELPAKFEHDFARQGLPGERFTIAPRGAEDAYFPRPDGLHAAWQGVDGFRNAAVAPRLTVGGDFDATVSYERFRPAPAPDGRVTLMLLAGVNAAVVQDCLLYHAALARKDGSSDLIFQTMISRPDGVAPRNQFTVAEPFEAESGRLRLARRGDMVYFLIAENDSPNFRLLRTERIAADDLVFEGLRFMTQSNGPGGVDVVWKTFSVRAERLGGPALEDAAQIVAELDRQRELLAEQFVHDFTRDEFSAERFKHWNCEPLAEPRPDGLRLVAQGAERWTSSGISPHVSLHGDFDVSLDVSPGQIDRPKAGDNAAFFLQVELPGEPTQACSVIYLIDDAERLRAATEMKLQQGDGSFKFLPAHEESAKQFRKMRLARRGKRLFLLYSPDVEKPDRLLAQWDVSDADIPDAGLRLLLHAGGADRTAEVALDKLSIRGQGITGAALRISTRR